MANSTTNIDTVSQSQGAKEVTINAYLDAASPATFGGRRASTSSGLTWGYYGGGFYNSALSFSFIANGTLTLTANSTNYIQVDINGVISKNTSGFTDGTTPLYEVVVGASTVTSYTDYRYMPLSNQQLHQHADVYHDYVSAWYGFYNWHDDGVNYSTMAYGAIEKGVNGIVWTDTLPLYAEGGSGGAYWYLKDSGTMATKSLEADDYVLADSFRSRETSATIASGAIAYTAQFMIVDTESLAATDDLENITGMVDGDILYLSSANASRVVTVKDNSNLKLSADFALNHPNDVIVLAKKNGVIREVSRSTNGA
jgi:hypothetical protein